MTSDREAPAEEQAVFVPFGPDPWPHRHRWQAVGVVPSPGPTNSPSFGRQGYWVAQSCECGKVRAVPLLIEDAE
jgi:hypothetical protein